MNTQTIGSDRIIRRRTDLLIETQADLDWWAPREYRKLAIVIDQKRYFVAERQAKANGWFQFRLKPWRDEDTDLPGRVFQYDAAWVSERDQALRANRRLMASSLIATLLSPLAGLLWHGFKERLSDRIGLDSERATFHSILLLGFMAVSLWILAPAWLLLPDIRGDTAVIGILLIIDSVLRYHLHGSQHARHFGFYEWLFILDRKRKL